MGNEGSGDPSLGRGDLGMGGLGTLLLSQKWGFGDSARGAAPGRTWWPLLPFPHWGLGVRIGPGATWVTPVLCPQTLFAGYTDNLVRVWQVTIGTR